MLPDFISTKKAIAADIAFRTRHRIDEDPVFGEIRHHRLHEGNRSTMTRADGSKETIRFDVPITATVELTAEQIRKGTETTKAALEDMQEQMAKSLAEQFFATIGKAVDEVGNSIDAGGRPLTAELILETLEKMELSFAEDGTWRPPKVVCGSDLSDRAAIEHSRIKNEPALTERLNKIIDKQREEWRVRESHRKLVD